MVCNKGRNYLLIGDSIDIGIKKVFSYEKKLCSLRSDVRY